MASNRDFIVAKNPDEQSSLPFLLYVPLADDPMWLKARERWPRDVRVYCHPVGKACDVERLEIIERTAVVRCERRGVAIDLVLARGLRKRSQFIFIEARGRRIILWQTARAAMAAKPALRIPCGHAGQKEIFYVDSRERYGYTFRRHGGEVVRQALPVGDYAAISAEKIVGVVERKTLQDFETALVDSRLSLLMGELASIPCAAIVVEGTYADLLRHPYVRRGLMPELLARLLVRYPSVSVNFLETKRLAEEWTYRYLRAVYRNRESLPLD